MYKNLFIYRYAFYILVYMYILFIAYQSVYIDIICIKNILVWSLPLYKAAGQATASLGWEKSKRPG